MIPKREVEKEGKKYAHKFELCGKLIRQSDEEEDTNMWKN